VTVDRTIEYRYSDLFAGEKRMELLVVPALTVSVTPDIAIVPTAAPGPVPLRLRTVLRILAHSGGALSVDSASGVERVYIDFLSCP